MTGLVAIIAESGRPDLGRTLEAMLGAIAQPDHHLARLVLPKLGVALGYAGPARFANRQMVDPTSVGAGAPRPYFPAAPFALLEGEPLDLPAIAGRLDLPADTAPAAVVAALYARDGADALARLDGHWSVAIADPGAGRVVIANDPFGMRSLYRMKASASVWLVASHPAALLAYPGAVRRLNPAGLADYLSFGHPWGGKTLFEGIEMLPAASLLTFNDRQTQARRYWVPIPTPATHYTEADLEAIRQLFNASVARSVAAGGPFSLALTGGMDARAVLSAMLIAGVRPPTVIHSIPGSTDAVLSAELARRAGATHHFLEVRGEDLPDLVRPGIGLLGGQVAGIDVHPLRFLGQLLGFTQVMFTGLGADVIRMDYAAAEADCRRDTRATVARMVRSYYNVLFDIETELPALLNRDWHPGLLDRPRRSMVEAVEAVDPAVPLEEIGAVIFLQERAPKFWIKGDAIVRQELETRHPFLDRAFVMRAWNLPRAARWKAAAHRYLITRNAPALADVPYERDGLPLRYPFTARERWQIGLERADQTLRKRLGRPYARVFNYRYADWLRGPLRSLVTDVLLDPRTVARPYFAPGAVQRWFDAHMAGQDHTTRLSALLALELTVRMFIEGA
ncbi:MAG: asparagine synthase-related protein [Chloroflexi bacterium]|nr:asparagine synthase-related protein [Chloroflexota bacterium]